ncbi:MAG: short-chain dehydrogenase [Acidimicrobiales bacterium]|jgi:decaprenylphospho-beta-D-erythro-pentofuranosid-2-ulose 2-reductase|nr:short-chain dehydrogenase [Acidimicrobiales bacterium]
MHPLLSPVVILGARSDIGRALARAYAAAGCDLILAARRANELDADCADLQVRFGYAATAVEFDVNDGAPDAFFARLGVAPGTVVMVAGLLGDQGQSAADDEAARLVMETNYLGPARYLLAAARGMEPQGAGCIVGISSVAGDRGRGSNYVYGSAKAGFTAFLSGLRNRFGKTGIQVITVKPGFVYTTMTEGMTLPAALTARPEAVAAAVLKAHKGGRDMIYAKPIWRLIMAIIRAIPERVFKKLAL